MSKIVRIISGIGAVACLTGLFANLVASPAAYAVLDVLFAGGAVTALVSTIFIK